MWPGGEDLAKLALSVQPQPHLPKVSLYWGRCSPFIGLLGPPGTSSSPATLWIWRESRAGLPGPSVWLGLSRA